MEAASSSRKGDLLAILWLYLADWHSGFYSSRASHGFTHLTYYYSDRIVDPSPIESRVCCSISSIAGWFQACAWIITSSSWRINEGKFISHFFKIWWWVACFLKMLFMSEIFDSLDIQKHFCIFFSSITLHHYTSDHYFLKFFLWVQEDCNCCAVMVDGKIGSDIYSLSFFTCFLSCLRKRRKPIVISLSCSKKNYEPIP